MQIIPNELPATSTDLSVLPFSAQVLEYDDHLVVRCPLRPDFWFGNYITLERGPTVDELPYWQKLWQRAFEDVFGVQKMVLQWEEPAGADVGAEIARKYDSLLAYGFLECSLGLVLDVQRRERPVARHELGEPRPVADKSEWEAVTQLMIDELANTEGEVDLLRWRIHEYRRLVESGRGRWWAMWDQLGTPLGATGIIWHGTQSRFQEVVTRASVRCMGICTHLCQTVIEHRLEIAPEHRLVVVAELGSGAERLYRRLGFAPGSVQWSLVCDPL
jgi:hypothetical protein